MGMGYYSCGNSSEMAGELSDQRPECLRKIFIIKLFGIIGILFTFPLGIISLIRGHELLSLTLILISIILSINFYLISKKAYYTLGANIIVYLFFILFVYLVYTGGVSNTGSLWIFAFPALALFLHGLKRGLIDITVFVTVLMILFIGIDNDILVANYSDDFKIRLIFSFLLVTFLASLYEYANTKSFIDMKKLTEKLVNVAKQDQLTELANRRGIHEEMVHIYKQAKENNEDLCVMLCDINFLHDINYGYGHEVGDLVIKEVAKEIQNSIKNTDTLARWSGEEFLILLPQVKLTDAHKFALALEKRIENLTIQYNDKHINVTVSTGISDVKNVNSIYSAVRNADNEMYKLR